MAMVFATVSCQTLDRHTYTGKRRSENYAGSTGIPEKKGGTPGEAGPQSDTALFFCAVNFIGDYDWRRDSSYGSAEAELILYRNFLPQVRIRAGEECCIGAEPGTHHLIGGQLYTEYTSSTHTVIKRNGAEILRYPGREVLKGIVLKEGDLWTLGQDKKGEGFTLRRNGESVFKKNEGKIFGDLDGSAHPGLYEDDGKLCFCYCSESDAYPSLFAVRDGAENYMQAPEAVVHDMFLYRSGTYVLCSDKSGLNHALFSGSASKPIRIDGYSVHQACLLECNGTIIAQINARRAGEDCSFVWRNPALISLGNCKMSYIYSADGMLAYVTVSDGQIRCMKQGENPPYEIAESFLFNRACAAFPDRGFFLALTPKKAGGKPLIIRNGAQTEVDVNGYISAVELCLEKKEEEEL